MEHLEEERVAHTRKTGQCCLNCSVTLSDRMDCSPTRLLCPWDSTGKKTGVGCHSLLQGVFPTQGSMLSLLHLQVDSLVSELPGKPSHLSYFLLNFGMETSAGRSYTWLVLLPKLAYEHFFGPSCPNGILVD